MFEKIKEESKDATYVDAARMLYMYIKMRVLPFDLVICEKRNDIIKNLLKDMYSAKNWFLFFEFEEVNQFILDKEKCKESIIHNDETLINLYDLYRMAIVIIKMINEKDHTHFTDICVGLARQKWMRDHDSGFETINWLSLMPWSIKSNVTIEKAKMLYSKGIFIYN